MWLTVVISYPIAWFLDGLAFRKEDLGVFTNEQLAVIIKHHETTEKRGGNLSSEAARIMLGVLNNENRQVGGGIAEVSSSTGPSKDIEKGSTETTRGLIVKWPVVKTVDMNDVVDKDFINKVLRWSYSRIPVVGKQQMTGDSSLQGNGTTWDGTQVFGFLHLKVETPCTNTRTIANGI